MYREFQGWPFHKNKQTNIQSQIVAYWAATFAAKKRPFLRPDISYFKIFHRLHKNFQVIRGFMRNGIFVHKLMADLNSELLVILFKLKRLNQTSLRGLLWQINRLTRGVDKTDVAGYRCPGALDKQCQALTIKLMLNAEHISPLDRVPFIKVKASTKLMTWTPGKSISRLWSKAYTYKRILMSLISIFCKSMLITVSKKDLSDFEQAVAWSQPNVISHKVRLRRIKE